MVPATAEIVACCERLRRTSVSADVEYPNSSGCYEIQIGRLTALHI